MTKGMRASFAVFPFLCVAIAQTILPDWLISDIQIPVTLTPSTDPATGVDTLIFSNGLTSRTFALNPDFGTIDFYSHYRNVSVLRSVGPEILVTLDGIDYNIGGLVEVDSEQTDNTMYLNRSDVVYAANASAWHYTFYETSLPQAPYQWTPGTRHSPTDINWPPIGLQLAVHFVAPDTAPYYHQKVDIVVHYEMYVGIPMIAKWVSMTIPPSMASVSIDAVAVEFLGVNQDYSPIKYQGWMPSPEYIELEGDATSYLWFQTDSPHSVPDEQDVGFGVTESCSWQNDANIMNNPGASEPTMNCSYYQPFGVMIGEEFNYLTFTSFRVFALVTDTHDVERHFMSRRHLTALLAPAVFENPIFFHMTNSSSVAVRSLVDQLVEVGFEMFIYSFGSGFSPEDLDPDYLIEVASDIAYANSKGIEVGGYDLISWTRWSSPSWQEIGADGSYNDAACFASGYYDYLYETISEFMDATGLTMLETDGPYPGFSCYSENHTHHIGLGDSAFHQTRLQAQFYSNMIAKGVYLHQPDYYFFSGGHKGVMFYNEDQFSLPRWQDISVSRDTVYQSTYPWLPTQGWMFMPLVPYHAGGDIAAFEPLTENIEAFEFGLAQYLGLGIAACYRGFRIFDSNETKSMVTKWVSWYKSYRPILISELVHIQRPDFQGLDAMMHVNYKLQTCGLLMVFNPTSYEISQYLTVPMYYTGITETALVSHENATAVKYSLTRNYDIFLPVTLPPVSLTWFVVENGDSQNARSNRQWERFH
jgi:hypothetical protein